MAVIARKHQEPGTTIRVTKATVSAGTMVIIGSSDLTGVALTDTDSDGMVNVAISGVYKLPVKGHNGTGNAAVSIGDKVYFTATEAFCDVDSGATLFGYALDAVSSGATTTIRVLLKH